MIPRSYLFALTDGGGTVPPELGVARRLLERGHRVTVFADASMESQVHATGATFITWNWQPEGEFHDWDLGPTKMAQKLVDFMIAGPAPGQAADVTAAIEVSRPDLVVASFMSIGAMAAAEAKGVPFDVLIPNVYGMPAKGMPPFGIGMKPMGGLLGRLRDRTINAASGRFFDHYALSRINDVRAGLGLEPVKHTWDQLHAARRELVLTAAAFDFPAEMPANVRYVGPILDDPAWAENAPWTPPVGHEPLVLVALSSTFQNQAACIQRIVDALGTLPVRGLVTTGPTIAKDEITAPANVTVVASAPHSEVMRHASLVVTHGGHGTVIKTLAAGVPLVILHHGRDQADNAVRVTSRGAGVSISRTASSAAIEKAVARVLGERAYAASAQRLGAAILAEARDSTLFDELESVTHSSPG